RFVGQQVPLRVLHADGGVDGTGQPETGHVPDVQGDIEPGPACAVAQELDVLGREIEAGHSIATLCEAYQVRAGPARDVEHRLDATPGVTLEAVDEEVHFLLPVHVEGDLVVPGRRVLTRRRHLAHQVRMASRRIHAAVMAVRPDGSNTIATSMRSAPTIRHGSSSRMMSISSDVRRPQGSGAPVPGASEGSRTSTSMVTYRG